MSGGISGIALAFAAGAVTFASPCVLPIVPGYIGLICADASATTPRTKRQRALPVGAFIFGFSTVFTLLGAGASLLGGTLLEHRRTLEIVGGAFLILAALAYLGVALPGLLGRDFHLPKPKFAVGGGPIAAGLIGAAFAAGWSPCIGPTLGSALTLAATTGSVGHGMLLLAVFSLGLGVPFAFFGVLAQGALSRPGVRRRLPALRIGASVIMLAAGALLLSGRLAQLSTYLTQPSWLPSI